MIVKTNISTWDITKNIPFIILIVILNGYLDEKFNNPRNRRFN